MENANLTILIIVLVLIIFYALLMFLYFLNKKYDFISLFFKRSKIDFNSEAYSEKKRTAQIVSEAAFDIAQRKLGAIITIERRSPLKSYATSGIKLDALLNKYLLISIFSKSTQLHDGAVIIRKNRILSCSCYYPIINKKLPFEYGSRHRAALSISKLTDSISVVVSETTQRITVVLHEKLIKVKSEKDLYEYILQYTKVL